MFYKIVKGIGVTLVCGIASEIIYHVYIYSRKRMTRQQCKAAPRKDNEVLFFPDSEVACKDFFAGDGCYNKRCRFTHTENSLSRLYKCLSQAKSSLDVCVFVICCADLGDLLIEAHQRGVRLRVICDNEQIDISGSQVWKLRKNGLNVRTDNSSYLMHHKFVVIDNSILINGSFNWTRQAISGNQENLMVIKDAHLVKKFRVEFESLWFQFDPKKQKHGNG